jgi:3D (Asp-Asp-Asp) domain-containing protein
LKHSAIVTANAPDRGGARLIGGVVAAALLLVGADASAKPRRRPTHTMTATAYCDRGKTRAGVRARDGIVAADPQRLPLGTRIRIVAPGKRHDGTYLVADTGADINGRDLDIFMPSCARAKAFGKQTVNVQILKHGTGPKDARDQVRRRGR